jgi:serine/threonine-protein kinase
MTMPSAVAHYTLLEPIGDGGRGEVFRARDTRVGRTVALKLVPAAVTAQPEQRERLLEEARAAAKLSHPNIATLFDVGEADGQMYLAYEFASGRLLREEMSGAAMNPRRALDLSVQIADGAADAQANGIIHGDLRPDTVMVTAKGSAKILDYGLAPWTRGGAIRSRASADPDGLPAEANAVVAYLSPEQAVGGAIDGRTDVFSLGTLTYEMLTGRNPFRGATPGETIVNVIQARIPPASSVNAAVPADLDAILTRALSRKIDERHQSAASLAAELRSIGAVLDVRTGDTPDPSPAIAFDERADRSMAGLMFAGLAAAAAAAAAVWWYLAR